MYQKIHSVDSEEKVQAIISAYNNDESINPIVCVEGSDEWNGDFVAVTGTHRIEAFERMGIPEETPVVFISEEEHEKAIAKYAEFRCKDAYWSEVDDVNEYIEFLYDITESEEVKKAIEDQF